ncbi:hypothetical protein HK102_007276, partial [Quaeritorhiza haematococci]
QLSDHALRKAGRGNEVTTNTRSSSATKAVELEPADAAAVAGLIIVARALKISRV